MKQVVILVALVLGCSSLGAQQHEHGSQAAQPGPASTASPAEASHHAFLEMERQAIERGEGFGMAMVADRSGYPGPRHVLDMKDQLKLTPQQTAALEKLFAEMKRKAVERGHEVLNAEARLQQMFAEGRSEDELREETYRVASLRAELRWVHLRAHLTARKLLTPQQVETYTRIRYPAVAANQTKPE
jgi:Spy/CpxP family protein refolding chaperone